MEQRPLRVGDNVDDYCPRERRITNHVIVALVGSAIRQTRCAACETEHVFKAGQQPKPRKKDEPAGTLVPASNGAAGAARHEPATEPPETLAAELRGRLEAVLILRTHRAQIEAAIKDRA